jgi:hypothetical protein
VRSAELAKGTLAKRRPVADKDDRSNRVTLKDNEVRLVSVAIRSRELAKTDGKNAIEFNKTATVKK